MSLFDNRTPTGAAPPVAAPPARSRWEGIRAAGARDPMPGQGTYRFEIVSCVTGFNPGTQKESFKVQLRVLEATPGSETPKDAIVFAVFLATTPGFCETKAFTMYAAGCGPTLEDRVKRPGSVAQLHNEGEAQFAELEAKHGGVGSIIDATFGRGAPGVPTVVGQHVDAIVARGKDIVDKKTGVPTGDYYRKFTWGAVR